MFPRSDRFERAILHGGPRVVTALEVLQGGIVQRRITTHVDGNISVDVGAAVRRRADVSLVDVDGDLTPSEANDLLLPFQTELRPWRGFRWGTFADGTPDEELAPLGTFVLTDTNLEDWPRIALQGSDRMYHLEGADFEQAFQLPKGQTTEGAIRALISGGMPAGLAEFNFPGEVDTVPQLTYEYQAKRSEAVLDLAASLGMQLFPDVLGVWTMISEPDPADLEPTAAYEEGPESLLLSGVRSFTREGVYNRVVATGETSTNDVTPRGVATDDLPGSPTRYGGPFGVVPRFFASPLMTTDDQCAKAAAKLLREQLGLAESVRFIGIVDPCLDASDVVSIRRLKSGLDATYVLDKFNVPLRAEGPMNAETRTRRVVTA